MKVKIQRWRPGPLPLPPLRPRAGFPRPGSKELSFGLSSDCLRTVFALRRWKAQVRLTSFRGHNPLAGVALPGCGTF